MSVHPILAALRMHKAGVLLIGLQIALTLAIVCNVFFIVGQNVQRTQRPTGLIERDLFMITQTYIGAGTDKDPATLDKLGAMQLADLAALRGLPDVQYATPINTLPLLRNVDMAGVSLKPDQAHDTTQANLFTGDAQLLPTLGLRLVAGRDFHRADVMARAPGEPLQSPVVIVSQALAEKLFPHGDAVGQPIYLNQSTTPSTIVGVVARILTANADNDDAHAYNAVLVPLRTDAAATMYALRARPGRLQAAMQEARTALFEVDPMRVIPAGGRFLPEGFRTFGQVRAWGYALDDFMVQVLTTICAILLLVTGVGMAGLTSFWVNQRRRQIGIRRALGATRANILHYFQLENLCIAGMGCIVGVALAIGINTALLRLFQMDRMPVWYVLAGVAAILLLGQLAALAPARRASRVPSVVATRSV